MAEIKKLRGQLHEASYRSSLSEWKVNPHRKPLLLQGTRQVGKTFAAR